MHIELRIPIHVSFGRHITAGIRAFFADKPRITCEEKFSAPDTPPPMEGVDGVIGVIRPELDARLGESGLPAVNISASFPARRVPNVVPDDEAIGILAGKTMREQGLTRFAYCGFDLNPSSEHRYGGFCRGAGEVMVPPPCFRLNGTHAEEGAERIRLGAWLESLDKQTAIFCVNDYISRMVILAGRDRGLRIPGELFVLGVDADGFENESSPVPLASVDPDFHQVGFTAAELLLRQWSRPSERPWGGDVKIPPVKVVLNDSVLRKRDASRSEVRAELHIRRHLAEPLELDQLARDLGLSRRSLFRRFDEWFGCSPARYIRDARMERAAELLRSTRLPVGLVAERVCVDPKRFSPLFKSRFGLTPSAYRRDSRE